LDPDSVGSADPDQEWESSSDPDSVRPKLYPKKEKRKRNFMFDETERPLYRVKKKNMTASENVTFKNFVIRVRI
jgi:hypothetical protein